ncbi:hypothetical protein KR044_001474 [Drosophila immigrans]|nr:hypothetical protein KR044_001474 [Drosophila immigrans]
MYRLKVQLSLLALLLYYKSIQAELRIINGNNAVPKQFPYQVYIESRINCEFEPNCGGVLISNRTVLTAAHCVRNKKINSFQIRFGAVDISNKLETGQQHLIVNRQNIEVHPLFDKYNILNDIALIRLPKDMRFDEYIQPVKLPDSDKLYDNERGVVSGWGISVNSHITKHLQYYNATVLPNEDCKQQVPIQYFPSSYICLKPSQSTPCYGDSGGPLAIRNEDGTSTLLGIASFVLAGCPIYSPAVYTRVSSFLQWIKRYE